MLAKLAISDNVMNSTFERLDSSLFSFAGHLDVLCLQNLLIESHVLKVLRLTVFVQSCLSEILREAELLYNSSELSTHLFLHLYNFS